MLIDSIKEARRLHLEQLRSVKDICEDNVGWLSRENNNAVKIRLIDLTSILDKSYPILEEFGPIAEAIEHAAANDDLVFDFVESMAADQNDETLRDKLIESMRNLRYDLEEIPGFRGEEYHPRDPFSYYFLGVTNQGKGAIAIVDETIKEPTDLHLQLEMPF